jgi:S-adenosylmethionine synthetase
MTQSGNGKGGLLCDYMKARKEPMSKIITCEQVSNGHPDKICDQIADAIVTDCLKNDKNSRVAIECLLKDNYLIIAGELTSKHKPNYRSLVDDVIHRIGYEKLGYGYDRFDIMGGLNVNIRVSEQSPDIALGVDKDGAGDQGIMYGYATNETPEMMPLPFMVATKFLNILHHHPSRMFRADAKAQVSFDYDSNRITTFLCSVQHSPDVEVSDFRHIIEGIMVLAAAEYGLNTDFEKLINPTGRFVIGGSFADCGVTGRKLACDTYGGIGRIGGGALSGKDPTKVDRSGAYMARRIAKDVVQAGYADKCEVQLAYAIGVTQPVGMSIECFGTEYQPLEFIEQYVRGSYDLTPKGIIQTLGLLDVDYNKVSAYGHFGKAGLPWED